MKRTSSLALIEVAIVTAIILIMLSIATWGGYDYLNPCKRYEHRWSEAAYKGFTSSGDIVYGPGEESVCVERTW